MNRVFQDELAYLKDIGKEFSRLNPKLARYLSETSTDPDVERLLEGFAFLTSGIRSKIEDEMPEFTHSILSLVWPNFLRVFPSVTLMKLTPKDRAITERQIIAEGTQLLSRPVEGIACPFMTTTDCPVYPLEIADLKLERSIDRSRIIIALKTLSGLPLSQINLSDLRLNFTGEAGSSQALHLWTGRYLKKLLISFPSGREIALSPGDHMKPIGLAASEAILPQQRSAFEGHRILQEYFIFPEKFYGYELTGLKPVFRAEMDSEFSLCLDFERPLPVGFRLQADAIQLYCVPAVNLFKSSADPVQVGHHRTHYRLRPQDHAVSRAEIFSIDEVSGHVTADGEGNSSADRTYPLFESFDHEMEDSLGNEQVYYRHQARRPLNKPGFVYDISFVHHNSSHAVPRQETISVDLTCFNRGLCGELAVGDISDSSRAGAMFVDYANITRPTLPVDPPLDGTLNWNLISNLSLNYMSLLDREAIVAILSSYDFRAMADRQAERAAQLRMEGIRALTTQPTDRLFKGLPIRGLKSRLVLREACFQSEGDMYLFASILAEFFSLYATVNSFHQLDVVGEENGEIYIWQPKIGRQPLI